MNKKVRRSVSPEDLGVPNNVLLLYRRDIPFINNVTYLGVTFNRRITRRLYIERTAAMVLLPIQM
jgi:hypothetical protein